MSGEYNSIKIYSSKVSYCLSQVIEDWKKIKENDSLNKVDENLNHIYEQAGFEESLTDLLYKFRFFEDQINNSDIIEEHIVYIGEYKRLNIIADNKHYTISSLNELKELKDDFTNTEINSFINFFLNN